MATTSVIAKLVHELLNGQRFTAYIDLVESTKCRCARLRIPYDATRITDAIRLVERTRVAVHAPAPPGGAAPVHHAPGGPVSKADARAILRRYGVRL